MAHTEMIKATRPGQYEYALSALLNHICEKEGAYGVIVSSGEHHPYVHYNRHDRQLKDGDFIEDSPYEGPLDRPQPIAWGAATAATAGANGPVPRGVDRRSPSTTRDRALRGPNHGQHQSAGTLRLSRVQAVRRLDAPPGRCARTRSAQGRHLPRERWALSGYEQSVAREGYFPAQLSFSPVRRQTPILVAWRP